VRSALFDAIERIAQIATNKRLSAVIVEYGLDLLNIVLYSSVSGRLESYICPQRPRTFRHTDFGSVYRRAQTAMPEQPQFHRALNDDMLVEVLQQVAVRLSYGLR
jgi:hypothetical protein